ncbi:hypothetical protein [Streptomyces sp. CA2R106]|uniref:hypothetical protein n=1 Tax=Streptomyces sp. CA2R106 TaxID=3120153 RepID=UPI00300A54FF
MMTNAKIGTALVGGYLLGRTKKARLAIGLGTFLVGRKFRLDPDALRQTLMKSPVLGELGGQAREQVVQATATAAKDALAKRVTGLADSLHERTASLRSGASGEDDAEDRAEDRDEDEEEPREDGGSARRTVRRTGSAAGKAGKKGAAPARKAATRGKPAARAAGKAPGTARRTAAKAKSAKSSGASGSSGSSGSAGAARRGSREGGDDA